MKFSARTTGGLLAAGLSVLLIGCSSSKPSSPAKSIAACQSDKKNVEIASEAYYARYQKYATAIDDSTHSPTTLVGAGLLREAPTATVAVDGYEIGYTVTATGYAVTPSSCA